MNQKIWLLVLFTQKIPSVRKRENKNQCYLKLLRGYIFRWPGVVSIIHKKTGKNLNGKLRLLLTILQVSEDKYLLSELLSKGATV